MSRVPVPEGLALDQIQFSGFIMFASYECVEFHNSTKKY